MKVRIPLEGGSVSGLLDRPAEAQVGLVLAHGAGAGMDHPFMVAMASGLAQRGVATLRFQFPFMERESRKPDTPQMAQAAVRAAVEQAAVHLPGVPLFAGGKSFGGRMSSQAQALKPLPGVLGLVFVGFPLHPAGKPSAARAKHLADVHLPMLFLQGTRDALADLDLIGQVCTTLANRAELHILEGADHGFHVLKRSGRRDDELMAELLDALAVWMKSQADLATTTQPQASNA